MPSSSVLWNRMDNYSPFVASSSDESSIVTLRVSDCLAVDCGSFSPILTNRGKEENSVAFEIYKNNASDYLIEMKVDRDDSISALLLLYSGFSQGEIQLFGSEQTQSFALNYAIMLSYLLATSDKDTLLMHASVVMHEGRGYLFMGKSGTGKSTHSRLWLRHIPDSKLINDDNPVVRVIDGVPIVFGSPWSGKTCCYRNVSVPIGGFIRLKQAPFNKICRQNRIASYASLTASSSGMSWEKCTADGKDHAIQKFIEKVPCWLLECLPNEAAARLCETTVKEDNKCKK